MIASHLNFVYQDNVLIDVLLRIVVQDFFVRMEIVFELELVGLTVIVLQIRYAIQIMEVVLTNVQFFVVKYVKTGVVI